MRFKLFVVTLNPGFGHGEGYKDDVREMIYPIGTI